MDWKKTVTRIKLMLTDKNKRFEYLAAVGAYNKMPDEEYLKRKFVSKMKYELDLSNPRTFSEKLQWLKIYDRNPLYTRMVDKYAAKKYVAGIIGEEHIIPTIGVWNSFDEIDFDILPEKFVIKCTHDSGGLVIVRDKELLNKKRARKKIQKSLKQNYYYAGREWPYKDVKPRVIVEKYMSDAKQVSGLTDYKFYCFNGEPKYLYVSTGLENHATARISFLNTNWSFASFRRSDYEPLEVLPDKPQRYEEMLEIVRLLSQNIPFLRVDLYEIEGQIYFSELTFTPCSGMMPFDPPEADAYVGKFLELPEISI